MMKTCHVTCPWSKTIKRRKRVWAVAVGGLVLLIVWFTTCLSLCTPREVSCQALIAGDKEEQKNAQCIHCRWSRKAMSGNDYIREAQNCTDFKTRHDYISAPLSTLEEGFPIAFSILMYKDIEQAERLLRAIYQPQNFYCIHVDKKAPQSVHKGMAAVASCLQNVFLISNPVEVVWGTITVLEPELLCMRELWKYRKWKYFINLTGQEFPLKTNLELVKILMVWNGSNSDQASLGKQMDRWENAGPLPHGMKAYKGSVHIVASRGYVDYVLHNPIAHDLFEWAKATRVPDEIFFVTLNHNPHLHVPGSPRETIVETNPFLNRYKLWRPGWFSYGDCHSKYVREVCIFGSGDLPSLTSTPHLFANKFHWDYQPLTLQCLQQWHYNLTRRRTFKRELDLSYYKNLEFVKKRQ